MLNAIRDWLNGKRDYTAGVLLYIQAGDNEALKNLLRKGKTDYNVKRLQQELQAICVALKSKEYVLQTKRNAVPADNPIPTKERPSQGYRHQSDVVTIKPILVQPAAEMDAFKNVALYDACRHEANKVYKEAMNTRARLFALIPSNQYENANRPDLVAQRSDLAIETVKLYNQASKLYERCDYVALHGTLPPGEEMPATTDVSIIPDIMVKQTLDNRRKNYNKLLKKESTPDRVLSIQAHKKDIKILEERWHLLKQEKF